MEENEKELNPTAEAEPEKQEENQEPESKPAEEGEPEGPLEERLQKIIAMRGYCSRRDAEKLILAGHVKVDGQLINQLGTKHDLKCKIEIDGKPLLPPKIGEKVYLAVYKPLGFICSADDPQGRKLVTSLVPPKYGRVFPIGRLDINSEGLIFLTNDGEFANLLMHPSSAPSKVYRVRVDSRLTRDQQEELRNGIVLEDGLTAPCQVKETEIAINGCTYEITLHEGKNREIRRMMQYFDKKVLSLVRIQIGPVKVGNLRKGSFVLLPPAAVDKLRRDCEMRKLKNNYVAQRKYGE